jgi:ribosomal protein L11 methylase PrmA
MLEDHKRTGAYYNAVIQNRRQFKDKVVLDVGTGSGILAIFSAMAGAKKVYAVEATDMAKHARTLVAHNKVRGWRRLVEIRMRSRSDRPAAAAAAAVAGSLVAIKANVSSRLLCRR